MSETTPTRATPGSSAAITRIERAIDAVRRGEIVILVDDEDRENEGDLVMAAELVTPQAINFMAKHGRGLICLTLTEKRLEEMRIPMMVQESGARFGTAFTVSVEARTGVTTGISAADRARTIKVAVDPASRPDDLVSPGHIFPLRARDGGVLVRTGQTEGSVDLARLAGLRPAGIVCEIMNDDGTMARMDDLERFAEEHDLIICSIADLIQYRMQRESLVERMVDGPMPCEAGDDFRIAVFRSHVDDTEHVAVYRGDIRRDKPTLVRVQYHIVSADVFGSTVSGRAGHVRRCMDQLSRADGGVLLYMYPPEQSPSRSVAAHVLGQRDDDDEPRNVNTPNPVFRDFGIGAQILSSLGVGKISLLSHTPRRIIGLEGYGLEIVDTRPLANGNNHEDQQDG